MTQTLKAIAFCIVACIPPVTLFLLYLAYWWARNHKRRYWERRFGIVHGPAELCRCGTWYCMHNRYLGSVQTGCMWFRRAA